jgi:hypothetical protein
MKSLDNVSHPTIMESHSFECKKKKKEKKRKRKKKRPSINLLVQGELKRQIIDWIKGDGDYCALDIRPTWTENFNKCLEGTCTWFLSHPGFQSWSDAKKSVLGWYNAPPGSGKTVLSAVVDKHIQDQGYPTVYYSYRYDSLDRSKALSGFRSIASQLLVKLNDVPEPLKKLYESEIQDHHAYHLQNKEKAIEVVHILLAQYDRMHVIIDGLDECAEQETVLDMVEKVLSMRRYGIIKWLFLARDEHEIRKTMQEAKATEICHSPEVIMNDIKLYLEAQSRLFELKKCDRCIEYWTAASEGNFLYSSLIIDILAGKGLTCDDEIHEELQKFPKGLTGCYTRCLERLKHLTEQEQELAR